MSTFDYSDFWQEAKRQLHEEFKAEGKEQEFLLWLNLDYVSSVQGTITLSVPSSFFRDRLKHLNYVQLIENKLQELLGQTLHTDFKVIPKTQPVQPQSNEYTNNGDFAQNTAPAQSNSFNQTSAQNQSFNTFDTQSQNASAITPENSIAASEVITETLTKKHPQLNPNYTFSSFVRGDNNSFAYNAGIAIAKNPGKAYNPVLIYGGVGLGKTHLMQSIGNMIYATQGSNVIYITAETFTNEFIDSIQSGSMQKFKNKYRKADVLLIDDIHFLQKKNETQEELFHTFNALYESNKQLVFTCDRPLSEIKDISARLRSRFERGLNVDLQPPDYETRRAILSKKLETRNTTIPQEVIDLIAKNVSTNVRDLEASLTKLIAYGELLNVKITLEIAQQQLRDTFGSPKQGNITVESIQKVVAESFGISFVDLRGKKRTKNIVLPRQIAMYIAKELTEYSTTELGADFGGRDHTTVMHSIQKIEEMLKSDPTLDTRLQSLIRKVKEYKV